MNTAQLDSYSPFETIADVTNGRLTLVGELDYAATPRLLDAFVAMLPFGPDELVVDLAGLTFIDASGVGLLVKLRTILSVDGVPKVRFINPADRVSRLFAVCGVSHLLDDLPATPTGDTT